MKLFRNRKSLFLILPLSNFRGTRDYAAPYGAAYQASNSIDCARGPTGPHTALQIQSIARAALMGRISRFNFNQLRARPYRAVHRASNPSYRKSLKVLKLFHNRKFPLSFFFPQPYNFRGTQACAAPYGAAFPSLNCLLILYFINLFDSQLL